MLQSFVGTIDERGLRTLTPEPEGGHVFGCDLESRRHAFWAVVDSSNLREIHEALLHGQRRQALQLLVNYARSIGSVLD